jgi:hypothetical protein
VVGSVIWSRSGVADIHTEDPVTFAAWIPTLPEAVLFTVVLVEVVGVGRGSFGVMDVSSASLKSWTASSIANAAACAAARGCQVPSFADVFSPSARSLMPRMMATGALLRWPAWATPAASISIAVVSL